MFTFNIKPPQTGGDEFTPPQQPPQKIYTPYNPLKDLPNTTPYAGTYSQHIYHLPTAPEHLFEEESHRKGRTLTDNITFYSGTSFALGTIFGGVKGAAAGIKAAERGDSLKIRVNRILNNGGLIGRRFGNNLGVLGVLYSGVGGGIAHQRGVDDDLGSVFAGVGTGALYRVFNGVRSAAVGGLLGGVVVAGFLGGSHLLKKYVPNL
ncbi:hypothetical protein RND81_04G027600 [Saponaria officinalis]|uniref:Uncharacterized protein n=1 Tax=Saponaria officinalis TaxID=3572 RepID=A0AAW1LCM6_SAPOF